MKALLALLACAFVSPAFATDYVYDVSMPFYPGSIDNSGWIMTNCDRCVLKSGNIVGWSLSQINPSLTGFDGSPFTASALAGSAVHVEGGAFLATPTALSFDFGGGGFAADVLFSSRDHSVHLTGSSDSPLQPGGVMEDCSARAGVCAGTSYSARQTIGRSAAHVSAPELAGSGSMPALTLLAGILIALCARPRRAAVVRP